MVAKDAALAELVRKEQDLAKQINAQLGALNNALSLPSGERDDKVVRAINASIDQLRAERSKAQQEIARRFPSYADLIDPKPPTVEQIKATLAPGEAFLSFYFGRDCQLRLGRSQGRSGFLCSSAGEDWRAGNEDSQTAGVTGTPGRSDLRYTGFRCRARLRAIFAVAQAG